MSDDLDRKPPYSAGRLRGTMIGLQLAMSQRPAVRGQHPTTALLDARALSRLPEQWGALEHTTKYLARYDDVTVAQALARTLFGEGDDIGMSVDDDEAVFANRMRANMLITRQRCHFGKKPPHGAEFNKGRRVQARCTYCDARHTVNVDHPEHPRGIGLIAIEDSPITWEAGFGQDVVADCVGVQAKIQGYVRCFMCALEEDQA